MKETFYGEQINAILARIKMVFGDEALIHQITPTDNGFAITASDGVNDAEFEEAVVSSKKTTAPVESNNDFSELRLIKSMIKEQTEHFSWNELKHTQPNFIRAYYYLLKYRVQREKALHYAQLISEQLPFKEAFEEFLQELLVGFSPRKITESACFFWGDRGDGQTTVTLRYANHCLREKNQVQLFYAEQSGMKKQLLQNYARIADVGLSHFSIEKAQNLSQKNKKFLIDLSEVSASEWMEIRRQCPDIPWCWVLSSSVHPDAIAQRSQLLGRADYVVLTHADEYLNCSHYCPWILEGSWPVVAIAQDADITVPWTWLDKSQIIANILEADPCLIELSKNLPDFYALHDVIP